MPAHVHELAPARLRRRGWSRRASAWYHTIFATEGANEIEITGDPAAPQALDIEPSGPFEGKAEYQRTGPKSSTWAGDLRAEFPGLGSVRLAGPSFYAGTCNESGKCFGQVPKFVREANGLFSVAFASGR